MTSPQTLKGKQTVALATTAPNALGSRAGIEDLQSQLEGLTVSPGDPITTRARTDDFIIATYLKEDAIDDGLHYTVRDPFIYR